MLYTYYLGIIKHYRYNPIIYILNVFQVSHEVCVKHDRIFFPINLKFNFLFFNTNILLIILTIRTKFFLSFIFYFTSLDQYFPFERFINPEGLKQYFFSCTQISGVFEINI